MSFGGTRVPLARSRPLTALLVAVLWLPADPGLIRDDGADQQRHEWLTAHRLTQPVPDEPCGLVGDLQVALQLQRRDAVLARSHEPQRQQPLGRGHLARLKDGADEDAELLAALLVSAAPQTAVGDVPGAGPTLAGLGGNEVVASVLGATVGANRLAIRPAKALQQRPCLMLVAEVLGESGEVHFLHTGSLL